MSWYTYENPENGKRTTEKDLFKKRTNPAFDVDVEKETRDGEEIIVAFTVEFPDGTVERCVRVDDN